MAASSGAITEDEFLSDFESMGGEEEAANEIGGAKLVTPPSPSADASSAATVATDVPSLSSADGSGRMKRKHKSPRGSSERGVPQYDPVAVVDPTAWLGVEPPVVSTAKESPAAQEAAMAKAWLEHFPLLPPKSGIDLPQVWPPFQHVEWVPPDPEALAQPRANIIDEMCAHDGRRFTHPHLMRNRTVYDSVLPSPFAAGIAGSDSSSAADSAAAAANAVLMSTLGSGAGGAGAPFAESEEDGPPLPHGPGRVQPWFDVRSVGPVPPPPTSGKGKKARGSVSSSSYRAAKLAAAKVAAKAAHSPLVFESRFEGGNLRRAVQIWEHEYDLILKADINTNGHNQWFYFSVRNMEPGVEYKFNIINLTKSASLFGSGMRPLMYSATEARVNRKGWFRFGRNITYYGNHLRRQAGGGHATIDSLMTPPVGSEKWVEQAARLDPSITSGRGGKNSRRSSTSKGGGGGRSKKDKRDGAQYYSITFTFEFPHKEDHAFIAMCYPYSYTDLTLYLKRLQVDPVRRHLFRWRSLCQTLAGNECPLLTITSFDKRDASTMKQRKGVVVTARVHPGESNASWMMKGVIDYLTGPSLDAAILRDNFVFKIVPMLNPDGVIVGNYRCSLAGSDLNRNYTAPLRKLHPTIFHAKQMIRRFQQDRELILVCDLHGHSRKSNIFMYGCDNLVGGPRQWSRRLHERIFPRMLAQNSAMLRTQSFSFEDCSFNVQKGKEGCARVVYWREFDLTNAYTMEASFAGINFGRCEGEHLTTLHLEEMGHCFCDTILDFCDPDQTKVLQTYRELRAMYPADPSAPSMAQTPVFGGDAAAAPTSAASVAAAAAAAAVAVAAAEKSRRGERVDDERSTSRMYGAAEEAALGVLAARADSRGAAAPRTTGRKSSRSNKSGRGEKQAWAGHERSSRRSDAGGRSSPTGKSSGRRRTKSSSRSSGASDGGGGRKSSGRTRRKSTVDAAGSLSSTSAGAGGQKSERASRRERSGSSRRSASSRSSLSTSKAAKASAAAVSRAAESSGGGSGAEEAKVVAKVAKSGRYSKMSREISAAAADASGGVVGGSAATVGAVYDPSGTRKRAPKILSSRNSRPGSAAAGSLAAEGGAAAVDTPPIVLSSNVQFGIWTGPTMLSIPKRSDSGRKSPAKTTRAASQKLSQKASQKASQRASTARGGSRHGPSASLAHSHALRQRGNGGDGASSAASGGGGSGGDAISASLAAMMTGVAIGTGTPPRVSAVSDPQQPIEVGGSSTSGSPGVRYTAGGVRGITGHNLVSMNRGGGGADGHHGSESPLLNPITLPRPVPAPSGIGLPGIGARGQRRW